MFLPGSFCHQQVDEAGAHSFLIPLKKDQGKPESSGTFLTILYFVVLQLKDERESAYRLHVNELEMLVEDLRFKIDHAEGRLEEQDACLAENKAQEAE